RGSKSAVRRAHPRVTLRTDPPERATGRLAASARIASGRTAADGIERQPMAEAQFVAEELVIWVLPTTRAQRLVRRVVHMLQDEQGRHRPGLPPRLVANHRDTLVLSTASFSAACCSLRPPQINAQPV